MQSDLGKLFIGGISWDTDEARLKEYFGAYGEVLEAVIMKDRATGRARGFGFIVFTDPAVAEQVTKEKHNIDGRMVEAKKAVPRDDQSSTVSRTSGSVQGSPGPVRTKKIFVGGLASSVTEPDFKAYFEQFGMITDVVVMYDHTTQRPRGFGFITYDSEEAVDRALQKTFHELNGKIVEVKRAVPKELSPGPSRSSSVDNYGFNRLNTLLNGYGNRYPPSPVGGYGLRTDRLSGRNTFGSGYDMGLGLGMNYEALSPVLGGSASFNSGLNYGHGLSPYNKFGNSVGFDGGNGGNSSFFTRNLWANGGVNYGTASSLSNSNYMGSGNGGAFGNVSGWDGLVSPNERRDFSGGSGSFSGNEYGSARGGGYRRNVGLNGGGGSNGGFDGNIADFQGGYLGYEDQERSGSFGYGLGNGPPDVLFNR